MDAKPGVVTCPKCGYPGVPLRTWTTGEFWGPQRVELYPCTECPRCREFLVVITKNKYAERANA